MDLTTLVYIIFLWFLGFILLWRIPYCKEKRRDEDVPELSIIVPARNEEKTLPILLKSLKNQRVKPKEVIVVDDQSEDATAEVARREGAIVVESKDIPKGWLGKQWACWQGANRAKGKILIFLDSDTFLESDGLIKIVTAYMEKGGLLSVWPYHKMKKLYEQLSAFFQIIVMAGMNAFTPLGSKLKPLGAFGTCIVCRRADYFEVGGHKEVQGDILEDIALGKTFLKMNFEVRCFGGKETLSIRMYPKGIGSLIEGFSRIFGTGAKEASIFILLLIFGWITGSISVTRNLLESAFMGNQTAFLTWLAFYSLYVIQIYWILLRIGNFGFYTALLFQIPLAFFIVVFSISLILTFFVQKASWKGRRVKINK